MLVLRGGEMLRQRHPPQRHRGRGPPGDRGLAQHPGHRRRLPGDHHLHRPAGGGLGGRQRRRRRGDAGARRGPGAGPRRAWCSTRTTGRWACTARSTGPTCSRAGWARTGPSRWPAGASPSTRRRRCGSGWSTRRWPVRRPRSRRRCWSTRRGSRPAPTTASLLERKRAARAADERRRPLEAYRAEELALMRPRHLRRSPGLRRGPPRLRHQADQISRAGHPADVESGFSARAGGCMSPSSHRNR